MDISKIFWLWFHTAIADRDSYIFAIILSPLVFTMPIVKILYLYSFTKFNNSFRAMHFSLIDRIETLEPGQRIVATKSLSLAEEYLRDHFPNFPVMPGVLMLEALTQTSAWLVRVTDDFSHSIVVLKEAKSVKYARFVQPGQTLRLTSSIVKQEGPLVTLKAEGTMEGQVNLKAHLILCRYNLAEKNPLMKQTDDKVIAELKQRFGLLYREPVLSEH